MEGPTSINHIVVLMMENNGFDWMPGPFGARKSDTRQ
jgi:phospholipase C